MSDEIKEILEEVNKIIDNTSYNEDFTYFQTSHISKLLDYITNLQQQLHQASLDIQELIERDIGCPSWCDKLTNLQQRIEGLEAENETLRSDFKNQVEYTNKIAEENERLKEDKRKAIEYIKNNWYELNTLDIEHCINLGKDIRIDLLNILQGENNDN